MREDGRVRSRRFLVVVAAALAVLLVASSLVPDPDQAPKPAPAPPAPVTDVSEGSLPRDRVVRAEVGELVQLTVTATQPTGVEIPELGELGTAAPDAPARFTVLADRPGRFEVRYLGTGRLAGVLQVGA